MEVLFDVHFQRLPAVGAPELGLYWAAIREQFPQSQVMQPLDPVFERFEASRPAHPSIMFELVGSGPPLRYWFVSEDNSRLLQVQNDRLIQNWRKIGETSAYPRYPALRQGFFERLDHFAGFMAENGWGEPVVDQCEITYVNRITSDWAWLREASLSDEADRVQDTEISVESEDIAYTQRFVISANGAPFARAYVSVEPDGSTNGEACFLRLTVRGTPSAPDKQALEAFFDVGREWIVRTFASITSKQMHLEWGRSGTA